MPKEMTEKQIKALHADIEKLHKSAEKYLHAALELAKHHGANKVRAISPHVLKAAKHLDNLAKQKSRMKKE